MPTNRWNAKNAAVKTSNASYRFSTLRAADRLSADRGEVVAPAQAAIAVLVDNRGYSKKLDKPYSGPAAMRWKRIHGEIR